MIDVLVPMEQEGTKAVVRTWLKAVGDRVEQNDPLVELETDKVAMEVPAPAAGVLTEILLDSDADAVPGAILGRIATEADAPLGKPKAKPAMPAKAGIHAESESTPAFAGVTKSGVGRESRLSPSVKRAVLQHDLDPAQIEGTGRNGRLGGDRSAAAADADADPCRRVASRSVRAL